MPQPLTSALVTALPDLQIPHFLSPLISIAAHDTQQRLIIVLIHQSFDGKTAPDVPPVSHTEKWDEIQQILTCVYVQATKVAQDLGKVLMEVDVLLCGSFTDLVSVNAWYPCADALYLLDEVTKAPRVLHPLQPMLEAARQTGKVFCPGLQSLFSIPEPLAATLPSPESRTPGLFPVVALGGTFDHLHAGHKILLSMGAWIASEKLIVGITDDALLVNKNYKEVLEPLSVRTERVRKFLEMFKRGVVYDIVPITDVYGPTAWDPNIQALVVSKETLGGARSIHARRQEKSLPALQTFTIDVISSNHPNLDHDDQEMLKATKISSTFIREWVVKNQGGPQAAGHGVVGQSEEQGEAQVAAEGEAGRSAAPNA